jgi:hypothetical protein
MLTFPPPPNRRCFPKFETEEQALAARNATHELQYPAETGRNLKPVFVTREVADERILEQDKAPLLSGRSASELPSASWQRRSMTDHVISSSVTVVKRTKSQDGEQNGFFMCSRYRIAHLLIMNHGFGFIQITLQRPHYRQERTLQTFSS